MIESTARQQLHQIIDSLSMDMLSELLQVVKQFLQREKRKKKKEPLTVEKLRNSGFIGLWADRTDITDSLAFSRQLREEIETERLKRYDYFRQ